MDIKNPTAPCIGPTLLHYLVKLSSSMLARRAKCMRQPYLSQLARAADLPGRRSLCSARTNRLLVPSVKLSTVGGRAFPVAGPTVWNSLPDSVISYLPRLCQPSVSV